MGRMVSPGKQRARIFGTFFSDPGFTVVPPGLHGDAVPGQGKQALCLRALQAQIGGGRPENSFQTPMPVKAA